MSKSSQSAGILYIAQQLKVSYSCAIRVYTYTIWKKETIRDLPARYANLLHPNHLSQY